jgi:hypothetical protein
MMKMKQFFVKKKRGRNNKKKKKKIRARKSVRAVSRRMRTTKKLQELLH